MESLKKLARNYRDLGGLAARVSELEAEVQECRQLNLRLAELCDVTMELLLPVADRDQDRIDQILADYREGVSDPLNPARHG